MKTPFKLLLLITATVMLSAGCSPDPKKACLEVGEIFNRCEGQHGLPRYSEKIFASCVEDLGKLAKKDPKGAKRMFKVLKKCNDLDCKKAAICFRLMTHNLQKKINSK